MISSPVNTFTFVYTEWQCFYFYCTVDGGYKTLSSERINASADCRRVLFWAFLTHWFNTIEWTGKLPCSSCAVLLAAYCYSVRVNILLRSTSSVCVTWYVPVRLLCAHRVAIRLRMMLVRCYAIAFKQSRQFDVGGMDKENEREQSKSMPEIDARLGWQRTKSTWFSCNLGGGNKSSIIERSLKARFMCVISSDFSGGWIL